MQVDTSTLLAAIRSRLSPGIPAIDEYLLPPNKVEVLTRLNEEITYGNMANQLVTLDRFLSRLDENLRTPYNRKRLSRSQYERNRVGANIEHARDLLLSVERQTATVRVQSQRQQQQAELQRRREQIKDLSAQLRTLADLDEDGRPNDDEENEDDEDEEEDLLSRYAPARKDAFANAGLEAGSNTQEPSLDDRQKQQQQQQQQQDQTLRARRPLQAGDNRTLASTSAREQLFAGREKSDGSKDADLSDVQRTETLMSHNRREQETLTDGLLGLARALKESSLAFGASLETEKEVLKRAEGGLDKNAQGMEAAEKRMSTLRRMSEGQGWWGRIKLYGFIGGLWLACFLLVFVGPKLRF